MTVCVAAIAASGKEVLAASDSMMSWGAGITSETSLKFDRLHLRWAVLLAGDDIQPAEPIITELKRQLKAAAAIPSCKDVENAIRVSWQAVKNRRAETHVLSAYDIDMRTFVTEGRDLFGEMGFAELRGAIERESQLSCELLVYGFDEHDSGQLLVAVHPGEPVSFTRLGFAAIGSGRDSAIASLMWSPPYRTWSDTKDATYRVAAAKFIAETALGVGKDTTVTGLRANGDIFVLSNDRVKALRSLWDQYGRPRIPPPLELYRLEEPDWLARDRKTGGEQEEVTRQPPEQPAEAQSALPALEDPTRDQTAQTASPE